MGENGDVQRILDVIEQTNPNKYNRRTEISTAAGARTGIFFPERDSLLVGVPHRGSQPSAAAD